MSRLLLTYYGDDFTGSTDALEQLTLAGLKAALFIEPPTVAQLKKFPGLQAVGVAGLTRSLTPAAMARELRPALEKLRALGARHVHYKVCSTFDSAPGVGNLGCVMDVAAGVFSARFVPVLAAAPALGRYTVFGNHFARYGIGSAGAISRLDRHPSISRHPVTPMTEADLRLHLAGQTKRTIALFDILHVALPEKAARAALEQILVGQPHAVLFDALSNDHLQRIGALLDAYATHQQPLFSIGSSGIEAALATQFKPHGQRPVSSEKPTRRATAATGKVLIGSGSCSPVTSGQIAWALQHGFAEVSLNPAKLAAKPSAAREIQRVATAAAQALQAGRSVILHTTRTGADRGIAAKWQHRTGEVLGTALGQALLGTLTEGRASRLCIAGGDTSSFAARALGIEALELTAPLTPGAPLCRAHARFPQVDGMEVVFKGGQVGAEDYFTYLEKITL